MQIGGKKQISKIINGFLVALLVSQPVFAAVPYPADNLLGQFTSNSPDFTKTEINNRPWPSQTGLTFPEDVAVDEVNNKLFILERHGARVIVHNLDGSNNHTDMIADNVLGQPDFNGSADVTTQSGLDTPAAIALDVAGQRLFVADTDNNRVVVYDYSTITNGENATHVLGQSDFTSNTSSRTQSGLDAPRSLAFDPATQYLYVGDDDSERIMVFDVTSITNGENAVHVLGAPDFTTGGYSTTAAEISGVEGLAIDSSGQRLFAADGNLRRVLVYDIASITDGENAVNVLGAPDFTTLGENTASASSVYQPVGLAYDSANDWLYVAQRGERRVTVFDVTSITNQEDAAFVLGQDDFTSTGYSGDVSSAIYPERIALAGNKLYVANNSSHRVEIFDVATITNGEDISDLLGQTDGNGNPNYETYQTGDRHPSNLGFYGPKDMVVDEVNHRLYIADTYNGRVLVHNLSTTNDLIDYEADAVLGQQNFTSGLCAGGIGNNNRSSTTLCDPFSVELDVENQRLFVAEAGSGRVLVYDVNEITNGEAAVNVIGQTDFVSSGNNLTATGMSYPVDVEYAPDRNWLFVTDYLYHRVTVYDVSTITNGMSASFVLGQVDFVSDDSCCTTAATLGGPTSATYDSVSQYLFVSDEYNARVVVYDTSSITNGENAVHVLGQPDFVTPTWNSATPTTVATPGPSTIDEAARVFYVRDYSRILAFDISTVTDNEAAVAVIGQTTLSDDTVHAASQTSTEGDYGLHFAPNSAKMYSPDPYFNRIAIFDLARITTSSITSAQEGEAFNFSLSHEDAEGTISYSLESGTLPAGLSLSTAGVISGTPSAQGTSNFAVRITDSNGGAGVFTTVKDLSIKVTGPDVDSDGVEDSIEDGGPNGGDANGDGTQDSAQDNVSTNENPVSSGHTTVETDAGSIENYTIVDEASLPTQSTEEFPLGLNEFAVSGLTPGASVDITVYYDQEYDTSSWRFMKYNRVTETYTDISSIVTYATQNIGGVGVTTATYTVTDGGEHDEDGLANGTVVDPVGPAVDELAATGSSAIFSVVLGIFIVSASIILHRKPSI